jgi:hypothetical protein
MLVLILILIPFYAYTCEYVRVSTLYDINDLSSSMNMIRDRVTCFVSVYTSDVRLTEIALQIADSIYHGLSPSRIAIVHFIVMI